MKNNQDDPKGPHQMNQNPQIRSLVDNFVTDLSDAIRGAAAAHLQESLGRLAGGDASATRPRNGAATTHRRAATATPKLSSARKLQGKYLGLLRTATGNRRAKAKGIAKKSGVAAAIKFLGTSK